MAELVRLMRRQWPVRAFAQEVQSHGRCRTDACFLLRDTADSLPLLLGIEAKLSDRARAVAQAAMNRYGVDLSYVAMPAARVSDALLEEAVRHGVGVLCVGPRRVEVALPALLNATDAVLRARVLAQLEQVRPRGREHAFLLVAARAHATGADRGAA